MRQHWLVVGGKWGEARSQEPLTPGEVGDRPGPEAGMHPPPRNPQSSFIGNTNPALGRRRVFFPRAESRVAVGQGNGKYGEFGQGQSPRGGGRAHLSRWKEGRGLAYLERKRLCLQRPPGLRFPEFPAGAGTQPWPPAAEVIQPRCVPGPHFPEFPGNSSSS